MASGRAADREDPSKSRRKAARSLDRDLISELHQGRRSHAPHPRAGHMTAPDHFAKTDLNPFAGGGRPHMINVAGLAAQIFGDRAGFQRQMTGCIYSAKTARQTND